MSSPILDSREPELSAPDILARLERYAAAYRSSGLGPSTRTATPTISRASFAPMPTVPLAERLAPTLAPTTDDFQPHTRRSRIDPASADLFPYDLAATIVGCVATISAYRFAAGLVALVLTLGLLVGGEVARRRRWFPSAAVNLMIGVVAGAILVLTA